MSNQDVSDLEAEQVKPRPRVFYGWWIVGAGMTIHLWMSICWVYGMQVFFTPIATHFDWSRAQMSVAFALQRVEGSILTPIEGYIVDRIGPRPVVLAGGVLVGVGFILLSRIQNLWMFYLAGFVLSAGTSAAVGVPRMWAIVQWFTRMRGRVMGIGSSGAVISGPLLIIVVWLVSTFGWRDSFTILGIATWIIVIPLAFVYRNKPEDYGLLPDGDQPDPSSGDTKTAKQVALTGLTGREALKTPTFWLLITIFGAQTMPVNGLIVHLIPYLEGPDVQFSTIVAASVLGSFTLLSAIGRLGGGWITDYVDNRYVLAALLVSQAIAVVMLANVSVYWHTIPFALFHGIAFGGMIPVRGVLVSRYFGRKQFGFINGLTQSGAMVGGFISPILFGVIFDQFGTYVPALLIIAVVVVLAIPLCFTLKMPRQMREQESENIVLQSS